MPPATEHPAGPLEVARALSPLIAQNADAAEAGRRLPDSLVEAFIDARLFQMYVPKALGGDEVDYVESMRAIEELARADGSAAWNVMIGAGNGRYGAFMDPRAAAEMFADPRSVSAAAFPIGGRLIPEPDGYRLSGRWTYCSGCHQSSWFLAGCLVAEGDHARRESDGSPMMLIAILPRADWQIVESWNTTGMRGTGSHDIVIDGAFIPEFRTFSLRAPRLIDAPLFRLPAFSVLGPGPAATCLGIARHALERFVELATAKRHTVSNALVGERTVAQLRLSEAEATLRAGRSLYFETLASFWTTVSSGETPTLEERAALRLACVHAAQSAVRAVDLVAGVSGSSAIQVAEPIERCWRDVHTAATHATVTEANYEATGRVLLGLEPGAALL
jgi:alkylation response protein AidB-like acyl-CoA dehydrogenase